MKMRPRQKKEIKFPLISDLLIHPFAQEVMDTSLLLPREAYDKLHWLVGNLVYPEYINGETKIFPANQQSQKSALQVYQEGIEHYFIGITKAVERLCDIEDYIMMEPPKSSFDMKATAYEKWIMYHLSIYISTVVSMYDLTLLLINSVMELNIEPRKCKYRDLIKLLKPNYTEIITALSGLQQFVDSYKDKRNLLIHRGKNPKNEDLQNLGIFDMINLFRKQAGKNILEEKQIAIMYRDTAAKIKKAMTCETNKLVDRILEIFNAISVEYTSRVAKYRNV